MTPPHITPDDPGVDDAQTFTRWLSGFIGALFGTLTGLGYDSIPLGLILGAVSGWLVGWLWCRITVPPACRGVPAVLLGLLTGAAAGLLSSLCVHLPLVLITAQKDVLPIGLIIGPSVGVVVGAVCGWYVDRAIHKARL